MGRSRTWKRIRRAVAIWIGPVLIYLTIRLLWFSMRVVQLHREKAFGFWESGRSVIVAFWHGRMLLLPMVYGGRRIHILISHHPDGELIAKTMHHFGLKTVRGSTSKGAVSAMRRMYQIIHSGSDVAITPDGPRGPRHCVPPGVIKLASLKDLPIVPVTYGASRRFVARSWDGFTIPYPFSRGVVIFGEPLYVEKGASKEELERCRLLLEERLRGITEEADRYFQ